jgi:ribosomal protein S18 acetylase RimI-like enzyme
MKGRRILLLRSAARNALQRGMPLIRNATVSDLDALCAIETQAFATDRLSRRSFRRLLASPSAAVIVAEQGDRVAGYAVVLFRATADVARLYSIAVARADLRTGAGRLLLEAAEQAARARGHTRMRLEVHEANERAARLYEAAGYRAFGTLASYYEDGAAAVRYERSLAIPARP